MTPEPSKTPRTDEYEAMMLHDGLPDSFRTRNIFDTMRDMERELAEANAECSGHRLAIEELERRLSEAQNARDAYHATLCESWIPVIERRPEDCCSVLIHFARGGCRVGWFNGLAWFVGDVGITLDAPTHWMPLPEAPK